MVQERPAFVLSNRTSLKSRGSNDERRSDLFRLVTERPTQGVREDMSLSSIKNYSVRVFRGSI
jgi:hypothetical protein